MKENIFITHDIPSEDNTELFGDSLPEYSFVRYFAYKIKNPVIAWINESYIKEYGICSEKAEKLILENFAYVSRGYIDDIELNLNDKKIFLADRYGSTGDAGNGGSARCGLNGHLQIKGNGVNPLVAINVDKGHSSGKLPLSEAVGEAIWSEICHKELPFGALRIIAIIRIPQTITCANTFGDVIEQPCAIMIREVAIRPAHYEPAINFWPKPEFRYLRDETHQYVEESIKLLENNEYYRTGTDTPLYDIVEQFVIRFATQIAVSRVKGVAHGSLTSSNIALDGRFLDLGTMSSIGDFSNVLLTSGLGATWDDHFGIIEWLDNFIYLLNRYSKFGLSNKKKCELVNKFISTLEEQENICVAIECGISPETEDFILIGKKIKEVLRRGKEHVSRLSECDFDRNRFESEVRSALESVGLLNKKINFKYRNIKFSRFTIFSNVILQGNCGSRREITEFISDYIS